MLGLTDGYDGAGHVTSIQDARPAMSATFGYDALDRLEFATGVWGALMWQCDAIGNRTVQTNNGVDTIFTYTAANQLDHTTGGQRDRC